MAVEMSREICSNHWMMDDIITIVVIGVDIATAIVERSSAIIAGTICRLVEE